jgi:predicted metal-binding membrane protein
MALRKPVAVAGALLGGALAAWIITFVRRRGMESGAGRRARRDRLVPRDLGDDDRGHDAAGDGADGGRLQPRQPRALAAPKPRRSANGVFLVGYLVAWTLCGLVAYGLDRAARSAAPQLLAWGQGGRYLAGAALVAAGLYELTPLKEVCLRHCRGPIHFVHAGWRDGAAGALWMGPEHGLYCVGCCWGLMLALFALGVMSLTWMAAIAIVVFVQKVLPLGDRLAPGVATALVATATWVVVSA